MTSFSVFSVQDQTGTVAQLTIDVGSPELVISLGDTGIYAGIPDDGTDSFSVPAFRELPFKVSFVLNSQQFSVQTNNANMADWPADGLITWTTGANTDATSVVSKINGANAYIDEAFFALYHTSRGNAVPAGKTSAQIQAAIVQATDYLDQKYRFSGVKLLQILGNSALGSNSMFLESWLTPFAVQGRNYLSPSTSKQSTEWPRQGVVDFSGDTINGIPEAIKGACAELAIRVLNGTSLQPDYDASLVSAGGVVSSITKRIGPLEKSVTYDTRNGLGFFASFPMVDRMLSKAGLLRSGGSRTVIR
jgi:hypothetical protein